MHKASNRLKNRYLVIMTHSHFILRTNIIIATIYFGQLAQQNTEISTFICNI